VSEPSSIDREDAVNEAKRWNIAINIDEHEGRTRAKARLQTRDGERVGVGTARLNPADHDVPEIGDELAVARALTDLGDQLLAAAAADIGENTHERDVHV
jgi:hypothetical protein